MDSLSFEELLEYQGETLVALPSLFDGEEQIVDESGNVLCTYETEYKGSHIGHKVVCTAYGNFEDVLNIAIECEDCNSVLYDVENPEFADHIIGLDEFSD